MKALKWIAIGAGGLVLIFGAVLAYVAATFNPNDYKPAIIQAVQDKTGRKLKLQGDIKLSLFPTLGAKLGQASLSERGNDREFASFQDAVIAVKLMPLLSKEVIVDAVELKGVRARIEKDKSGKFNFDDLKGAETKKKDEKPAAVKVDIARVEIQDGDLTYVDHATGAQYRVSKLNLKTGRIANGVTTPVDLAANIAVPADKTQLDVKLKTKLTMDNEKQVYKLADLDFSGKGSYGKFAGLVAEVKGAIEARLASNEYVATGLSVDVSGKQAGGGDMKVKLDAPKLSLTRDKVEGGRIALEAKIEEPQRKLNAKVAIASVQGTFTAFKAGPLDGDIEMQGDGRTTKAKLAGMLSGNLEAKRYELANLALNAKVTDPRLPKGSFDAAITDAARADAARETAGLDFTGKLDASNVTGRAGVTKFSPLAITFDVNADELDVDQLMGKKPGARPAAASAPKGDGKDDKIDLSALKGLNAAGNVKVGKLTVMNLKASQVRADLKVANARLDVAPVTAQLYQGTLNGSLSAQAADNAVFTVKQSLANVAVGPLLRDAAQIDTLEGRGTLNADLSTRGATVDALKKALNGTAAVDLKDGSVKGVDLAGTIREYRGKIDQLRGQAVKQSNMAQKTDFSELKATFNIKNGVAHNNDLTLKSPLLRVGGAGDIDIGNDRLNYVLQATLVATSKGQGGRDDVAGVNVPVKLTGPLDKPDWSIDFASMAMGVAKQTLQSEITKRTIGGLFSGDKTAAGKKDASKPASTQGGLADRVKNIFGR